MRRRDDSEYEPSLISVETARTAPPAYETSSLFNANAPVLPQYSSNISLALESSQPSNLASSSSHNEGSRASSSQRAEEVTTPPAQLEIERPKSQPREVNVSRRVPSSYSSVSTSREMGNPWDVYQRQLSSLYLGIALWDPRPVKALYNSVSIGDVGYINEGRFYRMFNVTLPWDDPSNNNRGQPEPYQSLDCGHFVNSHETPFIKGDYYPPNVSSMRNIDNWRALSPDE